MDKAYHQQYYRKRRQEIIDYLGGKCVKCNATDNLEVDHIDPSQKSHDVSKRMSLKNNKEEFDKCQLLCNSCHKEKTVSEKTVTHGKQHAFRNLKCTCDPCSAAKLAYQEKRNASRRK